MSGERTLREMLLDEPLGDLSFSENVAAKLRNLLTDKYTNSVKLTAGIIKQELEAVFRVEAALRAETPAPREPKLTIGDLDEILGGYDSAHVTRGTVLQRLNEWLRIRAAGEQEQVK